MVEGFHGHLKDALRACCTGSDWVDHLPWVMLGLRAAACEDTAISLSQAVFGSAVCLPSQFSPGSELDLNNFLNSMRAPLSRAETVPSRFNTAANQVPAAKLPEELLTATMPLCRLAEESSHFHYPDGCLGRSSVYQPPQAMLHARRGPYVAT